MEKKEKLKLIFLSILLVLNIWLLFFGGYPGLMVDLTFLGVMIWIFLKRPQSKSRALTQTVKVCLVLLVMQGGDLIMSIEDPGLWGSQFARTIDASLLITPEDPSVLELQNHFEAWLQTQPSINGSEYCKYSTYSNEGLITYRIYQYHYYQFENISWDTLDDVERVMIVDYYVRKFIVNWTSDSEVYGISDFKATPAEVLAQNIENDWNVPAQDDCDGQAVVTVSLLQALGFDAYIGDGKSHWFSVIEFSNTTLRNLYGLENPVLLNFWSTVYLWDYFNQDEFHFGQSPFYTYLDMFLLDNEEDVFGQYYSFMDSYGFWGYLLGVLGAIVAVAFITSPQQNSDALKEARKQRSSKLKEKPPILSHHASPIFWLLSLTYVAIGKPFVKHYKEFWKNALFGICLVLGTMFWLLSAQGTLSQHSLIFFNIWIVFGLLVIERQWILKLWHRKTSSVKSE